MPIINLQNAFGVCNRDFLGRFAAVRDPRLWYNCVQLQLRPFHGFGRYIRLVVTADVHSSRGVAENAGTRPGVVSPVYSICIACWTRCESPLES